MKLKSAIALILACLMLVAVFAGCGSKPADGDTNNPKANLRPTTNGKADNSITLRLDQAPTTLDPQIHSLQGEDTICFQVYEPLFMEANDGTFINVLTESFTPSEDGSSVEFTLKSDVKFHSGDVLKSEDVAYAVLRSELSPMTNPLFTYATVEVVDDTHFVVQFPYAAEGAGFYELYSYFTAMPIGNKSFMEGIGAAGDDMGFNCDGTGAYKFDNIANTGDVTLTRFEDYHGEASIDTVYFRVITGDQQIAFESGDIDHAVYSSVDFEKLQEYENVYAYQQSANNVAFYINNCSDNSPLNDIKIREAAARTLNREDICVVASNGGGTVAYNMATPMVGFYADVCNHFDQDLELSKKLMSEAGYSESNKCALTMITMADPAWVAACEVIKENMEQSYFTVNIEQIPDTERYFTLNFDMGFISIGLTTAFNSYATIFDSSTGMNLAGIDGDEQAVVLEALANASDEASTHEAMKAVVDSLAYVPIYYTTVSLAFDGDLNVGTFYVASGTQLMREFSWKA